MSRTVIIGVLLITNCLIHGTHGSLVCYGSCFGAVGVTGAVSVSAALTGLGFTPAGVVAGSWAAKWMALYGGAVKAGSLFAILQKVGATYGFWKYTGVPYVHAICKHLCYNSTCTDI